jgi:hypothetical protein
VCSKVFTQVPNHTVSQHICIHQVPCKKIHTVSFIEWQYWGLATTVINMDIHKHTQRDKHQHWHRPRKLLPRVSTRYISYVPPILLWPYSQSHYTRLYSIFGDRRLYHPQQHVYHSFRRNPICNNTDRYTAPPRTGNLIAPMWFPFTALRPSSYRHSTLAGNHLILKPAQMQCCLLILHRIPQNSQSATLCTLPPMVIYVLY